MRRRGRGREAVGEATPAPAPPALLASPDERVYGVGGFSPGRFGRRGARAARRVEVAHRKALLASRRAELEAERAAQRAEPYLPAAGEPGPLAARSHLRLSLPAHRATSEVAAGAYPFLAEEGLGSAGILIGQDAWSGSAFCYDPWVLYATGVLTNPNICLAGQIGRGKSALAKSLATRCVAYGRRVYVPGDPKGEWSQLAVALGGQAIALSVGSARWLLIAAGVTRSRPAGGLRLHPRVACRESCVAVPQPYRSSSFFGPVLPHLVRHVAFEDSPAREGCLQADRLARRATRLACEQSTTVTVVSVTWNTVRWR